MHNNLCIRAHGRRTKPAWQAPGGDDPRAERGHKISKRRRESRVLHDPERRGLPFNTRVYAFPRVDQATRVHFAFEIAIGGILMETGGAHYCTRAYYRGGMKRQLSPR